MCELVQAAIQFLNYSYTNIGDNGMIIDDE